MDDSGARLVAVGGGSGLSVALRGFKREVRVGGRLSQLTAVVTVTDNGGSSGRLRRDFGILPPGDIRNCIAALADDEDLLTRLFQYRFASGEGLSGHSFGNLLLTALTGITGDFYEAISTAEKVLSVRGRILPATLRDVHLRGTGCSGRSYDGEVAIGASGEPLKSLELEPKSPPAFPLAAHALEEADLIVLGPGSLYTSILPNLLIPGIEAAIRRSRAPVVLLLNLMTQPGETDGMSGVEHFDAIERLVGPDLIDVVVLHEGRLPSAQLEPYAETGSFPVEVDAALLEARGVRVVTRDLVDPGELIRHDPAKLAQAALSILAAPTITGLVAGAAN